MARVDFGPTLSRDDNHQRQHSGQSHTSQLRWPSSSRSMPANSVTRSRGSIGTNPTSTPESKEEAWIRLTASHGHDHEQAPLGRCTLTLIAEFAPPVAARKHDRGKRLKAGTPADWTVGDKTGTNKTDANDIGILLPPQGAPVLVTAYLADSTASSQIKDATLAEVGRLTSIGIR